MSTSFALRRTDSGQHVQVVLFAGVDDSHRANTGTLVLRQEEAADLEALLTDGVVLDDAERMVLAAAARAALVDLGVSSVTGVVRDARIRTLAGVLAKLEGR